MLHIAFSIFLIWRCKSKALTARSEKKPNVSPKENNLTVFTTTTELMTTSSYHATELKTTGTLTPVGWFTVAGIFLIFHLMSSIRDRKLVVKVNEDNWVAIHDREEYSDCRVRQGCRIDSRTMQVYHASRHTSKLSVVLECDLDLTTYLNELLRRNKPELKNETLSFPSPDFFCKTEDKTPIQTRFYNEI